MRFSFLIVTLVIPAIGGAQSTSVAPAAFQIASAVSPLPENLRAGARVLGYDAAGKFVALRPGTNDMTCLADDPAGKMFHVACYHRSLEPFMARGRELHALKKSKEYIDSVRLRDVKTGRYSMPSKSAALYQYFAPRDSVNMATGVIDGAQYLYVVYTPYGTYRSTGIAETPVDGGPWIMNPGKPWAHLMIQPQKTARITVKTQ
ncbi:MAG TPA: hypothetical protein VFD22_13685 [Gemmatimonadaceae bacterium]|nr:hypothetical protein [Gemmatimonadaceae bacterium]